MDIPSDDTVNGSAEAAGEAVAVGLSKSELALIIDALLQAEMTLPLIDRRHMALASVARIREQQIMLANRLEDLLAEVPAHRSPMPTVSSSRRNGGAGEARGGTTP